MKINTLINRNGKYWPFYGPGYSNHLPMAQYALYHLGAVEADIESFTTYYLKTFDLEVVHYDEEIIDFDATLGHRESYEGYERYFKSRIDHEDVDVVVKEVLNYLVLGLGSALFHGLIRMGYTMTLRDVHEVPKALASLACCFQALDFEGKVISSEEVNEEVSRYIREREGLFYLEESDDKEKVLINVLLELYLSTGSFIVLHTLTGLEALISLKKYFDDYNHVLDVYTVSVLRTLLRITESDYKKTVLTTKLEWDSIIKFSYKCESAHTIKFVYSLSKLNDYYPDDRFRVAAQIKLKLDHYI